MTAKAETTDYDSIADDFAKHADTMPGNALYERPATIALLPPLEGLDVLDAGCGAGFYTEHLVNAAANVVAFDPSAEMIRHARQRVGEAAELHACTTAELIEKMAGRQFDLILSCLVLHYVLDLDREMKLLAEFMKPGGRLIGSMRHPLIHGPTIQRRGYRSTSIVKRRMGFGEVQQVQRPLTAVTDAFTGAGLLMQRFVEAMPLEEFKTVAPLQWRLTRDLPYFLHFILVKP